MIDKYSETSPTKLQQTPQIVAVFWEQTTNVLQIEPSE